MANQALENTPELLTTYDDIGTWYRYMGDTDENVELQREKLKIQKNTFGKKSPETVAAMKDLADAMQEFIAQDLARLRHLKNVLKIDGNDVRTMNRFSSVSAFDSPFGSERREVLSMHDGDILAAEAEVDELLKDVIKIQKRDKNTSPLEYADTLTKLGDHFQMQSRSSAAARYYRKAYKELKSAGENEEAERRFGEPKAIMVPYVSTPRRSKEEDIAHRTGEVMLSLEVSRRGRPVNISLGELPETSEAVSRQIYKASKDIIFRPRLENGRPVYTEEVAYAYNFRPKPDSHNVKHRIRAEQSISQ